MALKVVDRWTTQHGSWDVNPANRYGIDQEHRDKYLAGSVIPGSGGDHHIFVKAEFGTYIRFSTKNQSIEVGYTVGRDGWINYPIYEGGWNIYANGQLIAENIGFPGGEHASTFLVVEDVDQGSQPTPSGQYIEIVLRTMADGLQIKEEILWTSK